ncbi:hypothetical protein scyTo_0001242 [Scyliorhinus torazame]|uniref:Uncharacterized protein n=1 Tax=Scyliorhinus torazame TaxID=75743 RepID=A0A401PAY8_SCYTO|nr:hypothetical protein [Scyliorhinus torazame]
MKYWNEKKNRNALGDLAKPQSGGGLNKTIKVPDVRRLSGSRTAVILHNLIPWGSKSALALQAPGDQKCIRLSALPAAGHAS